MLDIAALIAEPKGAVIIAPAAAGKSYFVEKNRAVYKEQHRIRLTDGDYVISSTVGWPEHKPGEAWWENPAINGPFRAAEEAMILIAASFPRHVVFFNGRPSARWPITAAVVPPFGTHRRQAWIRNTDGTRFPANDAQLIENRDCITEYAHANGIPVFERFDAALAATIAAKGWGNQ